jgi:hypothetical protein
LDIDLQTQTNYEEQIDAELIQLFVDYESDDKEEIQPLGEATVVQTLRNYDTVANMLAILNEWNNTNRPGLNMILDELIVAYAISDFSRLDLQRLIPFIDSQKKFDFVCMIIVQKYAKQAHDATIAKMGAVVHRAFHSIITPMNVSNGVQRI